MERMGQCLMFAHWWSNASLSTQPHSQWLEEWQAGAPAFPLSCNGGITHADAALCTMCNPMVHGAVLAATLYMQGGDVLMLDVAL